MSPDRYERPEIDHGSVVPIYEQVADWVQQQIEEGRMQPGSKFADSRELAERWEIGYQTVRRAMQELRERGLVEARVGKGTFVARPHGDSPPPGEESP